MITFQDLEKARAESDEAALRLVLRVIGEHERSDAYATAKVADAYDRRRNVTINQYVRMVYSLDGVTSEDFTSSNNRIASNFFNRLNTQRVMYSLGNGVSFVDPYEAASGDVVDDTKEMLGPHFDHDLREAAYYACIHGLSYGFWNLDRMHVFRLTEFAPLYDERTGDLRAGVRFWRLADDRPRYVTLYEEDGYTEFVERAGRLEEESPKRAYVTQTATVPFDGEEVVTSEQNYGSLPVVEFQASRLRQSTLVGMREAIDSYDLIRSGFANDLSDCAEIYWIVENYGGMTDADLIKLRDRMRLTHVVSADTSSGGRVTPYAQDVPFQARQAFLTSIRAGIYEDFGALDVHTVAAGATNDHIDAAYQPMDENAADLEHWVGEGVRRMLSLMGVEDSPTFRRNRVSNQLEQVSMVATEAQWLDRETVLRKLPNLTPDDVAAILIRADEQDAGRMGAPAGEE